MSFSNDDIEALRLAGVSAEQILASIQSVNAKADAERAARAAARREKNAERQRRYRLSRATSVTERDSALCDVTTRDERDSGDAQSIVKTISPPSPPKGGSVPPKKPASLGSRLPEDFALPDDWRAWAIAQGLDPPSVDREADKFRDYWRGKPGKDGRKADWTGTWRNWIRRKLDSPHARQPIANHHHAEPRGAAAFAAALAELGGGAEGPAEPAPAVRFDLELSAEPVPDAAA